MFELSDRFCQDLKFTEQKIVQIRECSNHVDGCWYLELTDTLVQGVSAKTYR